MAGKRVLFSLVVVALVFVVPASANAATGLTQGGSLIPTGKVITLTSSGSFVVTSTKTGNITCSSAMAEAKLATNTASEVKLVNGGNTFTSSCTLPTGGTATLKNLTFAEIDTVGGGTVTLVPSFEVSFPSGVTCKYFSSGINESYNPTETAQGGNIITITSGTVSVSPTACGPTAAFDVAFRLATQGTTTSVYLM